MTERKTERKTECQALENFLLTAAREKQINELMRQVASVAEKFAGLAVAAVQSGSLATNPADPKTFPEFVVLGVALEAGLLTWIEMAEEIYLEDMPLITNLLELGQLNAKLIERVADAASSQREVVQ